MKKPSEDFLVVTVLVITYNSSKYILETLNSIKAQSYPYLSVVISDDGSKDKTVLKCEKWIKENRDRFVDASIVKSDVNTGISANINRGQKACKTKWVKGIAGDDLLLPNCIQDNVDYVLDNPETVYLFSRIHFFGKSSNLLENVKSNYNYRLFSLSAPQQYERIVFHHDSIPAATAFYNLGKLIELDIKCDERIPFVDDTPKYLNVLKRGFPLKFFDKETVDYRVHNESISSSSIPSVNFYTSLRLFYYYYLRDEYIKKYGLDWTIQNDVVSQKQIYENYLRYRNHLFGKIYSYIEVIKSKIFNFKRFTKLS